MITVAIVGSRDYPLLNLVALRVQYLRDAYHGQVRVVSGGARGVDTAAAEACRALGVAIHEIEADWQALRKQAGHERNRLVVAEADALDGFWSLRSPGTPDAVELALAKWIPVRVWGPHGERVEPQQCVVWLDRNRPRRQRPGVGSSV